MELGNWALISSPSLLALLPLIIFIVFALLGKGNYLGMFLGIIVGFFLTGQDLVSLTNAYTAAISSSTTVIGLLIMFGTGLGVLMRRHVSPTLLSIGSSNGSASTLVPKEKSF